MISSEKDHQANLSKISMKSTLNSIDSDGWLQAMVEETKSILQNDTWKIVDRPNGKDVIGNRFVLKNKFSPNGKLIQRKARLIA